MKLYVITILSAVFALVKSFALPRVNSPRTRPIYRHQAVQINLLNDSTTAKTINATTEHEYHPSSAISSSCAAVEPDDRASRTASLIALMGILTGLTGVLCYRRFNCFLHMMTGCTFRAATSLVEGSWINAAVDISIILSFIAGTGCFRLVEIKQEQKKFPLPLAVAVSSSAAFCLSDVFYCNFKSTRILSRLACPLMAFGFGIMNAFSSTVLGVVTSAATGHYTKIGLGCAEAALLGQNNNSQTSQLYLKAFISSVLFVSILCRQFTTRWTGLVLPPLGCTLALLYSALFAWYSYGFRKIGVWFKSTLDRKLRELGPLNHFRS